MIINQFDIWIADLSPRLGTETGKTRPVIVIQSNLLNHVNHLSCLICPITSNIQKNAKILRVHLPKGVGNLKEASDIMIDQIRAIDIQRLIKKVGHIPLEHIELIKANILHILDIEI